MSTTTPTPSLLAVEVKKMRQAARIEARARGAKMRQAKMAARLAPAAVAARRRKTGEAAILKALRYLKPAELAAFVAAQQGGWPVGERTLEDGTVERYYITTETP